ncbi:MAG: hypothetical protein FJX68_12140 [Alphaproteobacteria bacterium]|nr:hypothetical protein [Alphaproteobacteria bacterium]
MLLAGCTPVHWTRQGLVPAETQADLAYCRQAAWQEAWLESWRRQFHAPPKVVRGRDGRIYYVERHPFGYDGDALFRELDLTNFCMRAKGYELTRVPGP